VKSIVSLICGLAFTSLSYAGGSIAWEEVAAQLSRSAPELLSVINDSFDVARVGGAIRLSARSIDVIEGRAEIGDRVPPYEFDCKPKGQPGPSSLHLRIDDWDDGWKFIIHVAPKPKS